MASNETILAWKAELLGAETVKDGLRKINEEVKKGSLTQGEANKVVQTTTKDFRNLRAEQTLLTRSFQAAHPQLATLTRTMSTFGNIARTGLNIANSLNIMWIRQNQTAIALSEANYEVAKATRELNEARKTNDPLKIAEAEEKLNIALAKQAGLKTGDFWTNLTDVATVGLTITSAVTSIFTNLTKDSKILEAITKAGSLLGGVFSGLFTLVSNAAIKAGSWITSALGIGSSAAKNSALAGTRLGTIFGLSFAGAVSVAVIAVGAAILAGAVDIMMENVSGQSFVRDLTEKLLGKGKGMSTKDILGINTHKGADLKGKGLLGGPNSYEDYIKGYEDKKKPLIEQSEVDEQISFLQPLIDLFEKGIPASLKTLQEGFSGGWKSITELTNMFGANLVSGVNSIFNSLIDSMNSAINSYNKAAKKMGKSTISSISFTPNTFTPIPMPSVKAATGFDGMVNRPTMFLAGEAGPEQVSISPNGRGSGGGINVTVNVQGSILTERELFRRVDENLKNELKKRNFRILQ